MGAERPYRERVTFWNWRRGTGQGAAQGTAAVNLVPDLAPIEIYTADRRVVGFVAARGRRVTDLLREDRELQVWQPTTAGADAWTDVEGGGEWQMVESASVLLAMPPEWRVARQLRLHRRLQRVALTIGPFSVTGNLHLSIDADGTPRPTELYAFLPLTEAHLLSTADPAFEHVVSVVIVNASHVSSMVPLVTLA